MAYLLKTWRKLRSSYWFLPALMSIGAALLSFLLARVDLALDSGRLAHLAGMLPIQAAGARSLLSTIAGSVIGVAGVTFSITIAALAYTTSTLGPRLLTNFMNDTGNQITLGTFMATFVYCLLLLGTIHGAAHGTVAFVPHLSLLFAMTLAGASLAALIYFIHHITESLHVSNVVGNVARELDQALADHAERSDAARELPPAYLPADFSDTAVPVRARSQGYIQNLMHGTLVGQAARHDLVLRQARGPGDFAAIGQVLLWAWPATRIDDDLAARLSGAYAFGRQRTQSQDIHFLVNELIEVAARALSPGINDPYTAMGCLDWLSTALIKLAANDPLPGHRFDSDQHLRLWVPALNFETLAQSVFDQLRPYFAGDRNAAIHLLDTLGEIGDLLHLSSHRQCLRAQADALLEAAASRAMPSRRDTGALEHAHRRAVRRLTPAVE